MQFIAQSDTYAAAFKAELEVTDGNTRLKPLCLNALLNVSLEINDGPPPQIICENLARFAAEGPLLKSIVTDQHVITGGFALALNPGTMDPCGANNRRYLKEINVSLSFHCDKCDIHVFTYRLAQALDYALHCTWDATLNVVPSLDFEYKRVLKLLELSKSVSSILGGVGLEQLNIACENTISASPRKAWDPCSLQFMCPQEYTSASWEVLDSDDHEVLLLPLNMMSYEQKQFSTAKRSCKVPSSEPL